MENQEAIKRIEEHTRIHFAAEYPHAVYITEALNMAIEALKAQEPVKPADKTCSWWDNTWGRCGHCNAPLPMLEGLKSKFCWMCGRPVKWE